MGVFISRVIIKNFRNFKDLDVNISNNAVIVGENRVGKSNFLYALRLLLDPTLPDSARMLKEDDFWDGLTDPMKNGEEIVVSIDFKNVRENRKLLSILSDYFVRDESENEIVRITYKYKPIPGFETAVDAEERLIYEFRIYGGNEESNVFTSATRRWMPLDVLQALRDAESDFRNWHRSPLKPLIDRLEIDKEQLESATSEIDSATEKITALPDINRLSEDIETRLNQMIGMFHSISPTLGFASANASKLIHSLRLFVDGEKQRTIGEDSLGICNVIYLTLFILELERKEAVGERVLTILAIEEPEAHLHPHLQRLVFRDFLNRDAMILLTTHSPHIVSVSPLKSLVVLRNNGKDVGSQATSTALLDFSSDLIDDLERYIDATRGEIFFARGIILVEGIAEMYIVPACAKLFGYNLDQKGISVCNIHGTDFAPFVRILEKNALNIPFIIISDGDPIQADDDFRYNGINRMASVIEILEPSKLFLVKKLIKGNKWQDIIELLQEYGIFLNMTTLEIELDKSGNREEIINTLSELGSGTLQLSRLNEALSTDDYSKMMKIIESHGKGRFSQRFAPKLENEKVPDYLRIALENIWSQIPE